MEQVVGGSKDMKHLFGHWRDYVTEGYRSKDWVVRSHPHQNLNSNLMWSENDQLRPDVRGKIIRNWPNNL